MSEMLPPIVARLLADITEFKAGMGEAAALAESTAGKSKAAFAGMAGVGKAALLGLGVAAVGVGIESTKMAASFQSAMELIHTQAGASQAEVDSMSKSVLGLAGKTATAPDELAKGLYHLESTGLRGAKALDALKTAAEGAKTGQANLEDVTNALNAVIASHISGANNLNEAMGALNATVGAGDMRMQDLADAMGTGLLAVVKGFGLSLNDVSAALATFGDNNIRGADAATQLRMAVLFMAKPAKSAASALGSIGLTTKSLANDMRNGGLGQALNDLHAHLIKAGDGGKKMGEVLVNAFGHKAGTGLSVLVSQLSRFKSKVDEVHKGSKNFGEDFKATAQTLSFQVSQLKATIEALAIRIGTWLIPKLQEAAAATMQVVQWFEKHREIAVLLGAAVGGVLATAIAAYTVSMISAAAATIAATWPILAVVAAVAGLVIAFRYGWQNSQTFRDIVRGALADLKVAFDAILAAGTAVFHALGDVWTAFANGPLAFVREQVKVFTDFWHTHADEIKTVARVAWTFIRTIIVTEWRVIWDLLRPGLTLLGAAFKLAWDVAKTVVVTAWNVIADAIRTGVKVWTDLVGVVLDVITGKWGRAWDDAKKLVGDAIHGVESIIGDFAKGALTLLYDAGRDIVQGLINGFKSMFGAVGGVLHDLTKLIPLHKGPPSKDRVLLYGAGQSIVQGLIDGMKSMESELKSHLDKVTAQISSIRQAADSLRGQVMGAVIGDASLSNVTGTGTNGAVQGGDIVGFLQHQRRGDAKFLRELEMLKKRGLSSAYISQIAQMGAAQGGQYADALTSSTNAQLRQISALGASIGGIAKRTGTFTANDVYGQHLGQLVGEQRATRHVLEEIRKALTSKAGEPTLVKVLLDGKEILASTQVHGARYKQHNATTGLG